MNMDALGGGNCGRWENGLLREPLPTIFYRCDRCGAEVRSFGERRMLEHMPTGHLSARKVPCGGRLIECRLESR